MARPKPKSIARTEPAAPPAVASPPRELLLGLARAFVLVTEQVGRPLAILFTVLSFTWLMADRATQSDVVREVYFGGITHTRYVGTFFALTLLTGGAGSTSVVYWLKKLASLYVRENRRLRGENDRLRSEISERTPPTGES